MDRIKLPPIHWLQAFEASARHLSFKDAADELHLTASAVSQKIKQLEDSLGITLFTRMTRTLALTSAGNDFRHVAKDVMNFYQQRQREFMRRFNRRDLKLSMIPFIAYDIVLPALPQFQEQYSETELRIEAATSVVNFAEDDTDAAIRFGAGEWPGLVATPLCRCQSVLVCSPAFLEQNPIDSPLDLQNHTLISMRGVEDVWSLVGQNLGVPDISRCRTLGVDSYLGAMIAAQQGLGIAIALKPLINPWLNDGRLVSLLGMEADMEDGYYFVRRVQDRDDQRLQQLYIWLKNLFLERDAVTSDWKASKHLTEMV